MHFLLYQVDLSTTPNHSCTKWLSVNVWFSIAINLDIVIIFMWFYFCLKKQKRLVTLNFHNCTILFDVRDPIKNIGLILFIRVRSSRIKDYYFSIACVFFYKARTNDIKKSGSQLNWSSTLIFCQMLINILLKKGKKIHKKNWGT